MIHGTITSYGRGCRCDPCRLARNRYEMRRRKHRALNGTRYLTDATGTCRRLRALARLGWPYKAIAAECGWTTAEAVGQTLKRRTVERRTVAAVKVTYDRLSMTRGPSARVARMAESKGWLPPLAWDDDTIDDPDATPYIGTEHYGASVEDIEWLIRTGGTWESISVRMGITKDAVEQALRRAGRTDLTARLTPEGATNPRGRVA